MIYGNVTPLVICECVWLQDERSAKLLRHLFFGSLFIRNNVQETHCTSDNTFDSPATNPFFASSLWTRARKGSCFLYLFLSSSLSFCFCEVNSFHGVLLDGGEDSKANILGPSGSMASRRVVCDLRTQEPTSVGEGRNVRFKNIREKTLPTHRVWPCPAVGSLVALNVGNDKYQAPSSRRLYKANARFFIKTTNQSYLPIKQAKCAPPYPQRFSNLRYFTLPFSFPDQTLFKIHSQLHIEIFDQTYRSFACERINYSSQSCHPRIDLEAPAQGTRAQKNAWRSSQCWCIHVNRLFDIHYENRARALRQFLHSQVPFIPKRWGQSRWNFASNWRIL